MNGGQMRSFGSTAQVAAVDRGKAGAIQTLQVGAQLPGLLQADLAQGDVQPALKAAVGVPFGFAVANKPEVCRFHVAYSTSRQPCFWGREGRWRGSVAARVSACVSKYACRRQSARRTLRVASSPPRLSSTYPCPIHSSPVGVVLTRASRALSSSPTNVSPHLRISPWVRSTWSPCSAPRYSRRC